MSKMSITWFVLVFLFGGMSNMIYGDKTVKNEIEILTKNSFMIMGIAIKTSNAPGCAEKTIPALWEKFYSEKVAEKIPNKKSTEVYGLYTDYEGDHTMPYTLVIGCEVENCKDVPDGMVVKTIPSSSYAVFKAKGAFPQSVAHMWATIWQTKINRSFACDFEVYGKSFQDQEPEVPIYISLKEK